jgi:hypothetical protein
MIVVAIIYQFGEIKMFCKECGTENLDTQIECIKCETIINNNLPLDGSDRTKVIGFFAFLILPFAWFGGSVIIILIVIFSIYIMNKDKSFIPILKAKGYINFYLLLVASIFVMIGLFNIEYGWWILIIISFVATPILIKIFDFLFFEPLIKHENWIINNGIFADYKGEKSFIEKTTEKLQTIKKEPLNVADELLKWAELKEKGLISEDEFQKAKEKILDGKL